MCYIALAMGVHPEFPFILATNRDEFYQRECLPIGSHFGKGTWAGKDLKGGGTWLGFNQNGKVGMLTNYHENQYNQHAPTRGQFIVDYIQSSKDEEHFLKPLQEQADEYNGYSLLVGNHQRMHYFNNRSKITQKLNDGIHILSNGHLNDNWPKYKKGHALLTDICKDAKQQPAELELQLLTLLQDKERAPHQLNSPESFGKKIEIAATSIFVESDIYGTKSSLIIMIDNSNQLYFKEYYYPVLKQSSEVNEGLIQIRP